MDIERKATIVDSRALATTRKGVFAAGDLVLGPSTVIEAVGQGNEVARSVDCYLRTGSLEKKVILPGYEVVEQLFDLEDYAQARRPEMTALSVEERRNSFAEVERSMPEGIVREECKRCLRCDLEWLETQGLGLEPQPDRPATFGK